MNKTNAMRILDSEKVAYIAREYDEEITDGETVAKTVGVDPDRVFKTLVTVGNDLNHYVFIVPVNFSLDLKKAAYAVGVKRVEMIKLKDLFPLTGYVHGGCSPVGMKKTFPTYLDETAILYDEIFVSGGRIGLSVGVAPETLAGYLDAAFADLID